MINLPLVDAPEKIEAYLAAIDGAIPEGLATIETVQVRWYRGGGELGQAKRGLAQASDDGENQLAPRVVRPLHRSTPLSAGKPSAN